MVSIAFARGIRWLIETVSQLVVPLGDRDAFSRLLLLLIGEIRMAWRLANISISITIDNLIHLLLHSQLGHLPLDLCPQFILELLSCWLDDRSAFPFLAELIGQSIEELRLGDLELIGQLRFCLSLLRSLMHKFLRKEVVIGSPCREHVKTPLSIWLFLSRDDAEVFMLEQ